MITPALRELFTAMAETADVPAPASRDEESQRAYLTLMEHRLIDLRVVLRHMVREDFDDRHIPVEVKILREWTVKHSVTYDPYIPAEPGQEKS